METRVPALSSPLVTDAGWFLLPGMGVVLAHGKDRVRYLNAMLSHEVKGLEPGQGVRGLLLTAQGKLVSDLRVYVEPECLRLLFEGPVFKAGMEMLERFLIADRVRWEPLSEQVAVISVQGPHAAQRFQAAFPDAARPDAVHHHLSVDWLGTRLMVANEPRLGECGFDVWVDLPRRDALVEHLERAGVRPVSALEWDQVRIARGIPQSGVDVIQSNLPLEAGPAYEADTIHHHKGCYIGQEVICRVKARGQVNWLWTSFDLPEGVEAGTELFSPEKRMGWITSVTQDPALGRIGGGYVHRNVRSEGARLRVGSAEGALEVLMHLEPPLPCRAAMD